MCLGVVGEEGGEAGVACSLVGGKRGMHAFVGVFCFLLHPPHILYTQFGMVRATSILNRCSITVTHSDSESVNECMLFEGEMQLPAALMEKDPACGRVPNTWHRDCADLNFHPAPRSV